MTTEANGIAQAAVDGLQQAGASNEGSAAAAQGNDKSEARGGDLPPSFADEDANLQALIAEQERLDAEEAAKAGGKQAGDGVVPDGEKKEAATDGKTGTVQVPADASQASAQTGAIIALRKKLQETTAALLIKEGENKALKALVTPGENTGDLNNGGQQQSHEEQTPEQVLADIEAERERIAAEVDAGRMTMVEYTKKANELTRSERDITLSMISVANTAAPTNDLALEEWTNTSLIPAYPVLSKLTKSQLDPLAAIAYQQAEMEGKPIQDGPSGTKELRQRIADLAEQTYDKQAWLKRMNAAGGQSVASGQQKPGATTGAVGPTAQQREEKLRMAAEMPPEIGKIGAGATGGEMTEEQIEAAYMNGNEDQRLAFMKSHPALIQKVMGPGYRLRA